MILKNNEDRRFAFIIEEDRTISDRKSYFPGGFGNIEMLLRGMGHDFGEPGLPGGADGLIGGDIRSVGVRVRSAEPGRHGGRMNIGVLRIRQRGLAVVRAWSRIRFPDC